jgi:HAT1-interacting factor 1
MSSRQIAEVHYKLCIVYDMTAGRLARAIDHAKKAEASVQARMDEVTARLKTASMSTKAPQSETKVDIKGKGKATSSRIGSEPSLESMSKAQLDSELKELRELLEDVSLKVSHSPVS